jgi:hypothetical protein
MRWQEPQRGDGGVDGPCADLLLREVIAKPGDLQSQAAAA